MATIQFEPMSVGRIFDRAFLIYRNNVLRFIVIASIIHVPLALLSALSNSWKEPSVPARQPVVYEQALPSQEGRPPATRPDSGGRRPVLFNCLGSSLGFLLQMVAGMFCEAALVKSVSEIYLGNEITIGQAYGFILPKSVALVVATIYVTLAIWLGFILFIVPGVIFGLWFSLVTPVIVVESHSATSGMSRSKALVTDNLGKVFAVTILGTLLFYPIWLPLNYLLVFIGRALSTDSGMLISFLRQLAATLSGILVTPISAAAFILLYYDLRIRKEGFDLQMLAQSMASERGELRAA